MKKILILGLIISINIYCSEPYTPESDYTNTFFKNGKIKKKENVLARLRSVRFKLEESIKLRQKKIDLEKEAYYQRLLDDTKRIIINRASFLKKEQERLLAEEALRIEKKKADEDLIKLRQKKIDLEKEAYYQRLLDDTKRIIINDEIRFLDQYNKKHRQTW